jgi:hypothetical protein
LSGIEDDGGQAVLNTSSEIRQGDALKATVLSKGLLQGPAAIYVAPRAEKAGEQSAGEVRLDQSPGDSFETGSFGSADGVDRDTVESFLQTLRANGVLAGEGRKTLQIKESSGRAAGDCADRGDGVVECVDIAL